MGQDVLQIDSQSVGDASRHCAFDHLEQTLLSRPGAPADLGRVTLIVRRSAGGRRETPEHIHLGIDVGVPGDAWGRRAAPQPEAQITVMQRDVAELIANGQPLVLFGDNLLLDLDLSRGNLPLGSRVRVGRATLEVTQKPHNGCHKFAARFGADALRFVCNPELRHRNLRGIYMRVIENGAVTVGDAVEVIARASSPSDLAARSDP